MRTLKLDTKEKYKLWLLILGGLVFGVSIRHIRELTNLFAWDELGYWGSAAFIAGFDWSSVVSAYAGYYSYGYSLILALLLKYVASKGCAYQLAILINGIFNTASFFLSYYIGVSYFGKDKRKIILIASMVTAFYANNITQANYAWTECILIFLYWVLLALFCSINQRYHIVKLMLLGSISIYMLMVHIRTIGIVIACFTVIFIMALYKKIRVKDFAVFILLCIISMVVVLRLKAVIRNSVWLDVDEKQLANTFSAVFGGNSPWIIAKLKSTSGMIDLIKTFFLRFFYFGLTTFMLFWVFLKDATKNLILGFRNKKPDFFLSFLLLSMLGVFGVMSLQLSSGGSYQTLLYGRYQDIIVGPIFLLGSIYFICNVSQRIWEKEYLIYLILMLVLYKIAITMPIYKDYYVINCNVELDRYWLSTEMGGYNLLLPLLIAMTVFVVLCVVRHFYFQNEKIGVLIFFCISITFCLREYNASETIYEKTFNNYNGMTEFYLRAAEICDSENVVFLYNADISTTVPSAMGLQFTMYDKKIEIISALNEVSEKNFYLFIPCQRLNETEYAVTLNVNGELVLADKFLALYKINS